MCRSLEKAKQQTKRELKRMNFERGRRSFFIKVEVSSRTPSGLKREKCKINVNSCSSFHFCFPACAPGQMAITLFHSFECNGTEWDGMITLARARAKEKYNNGVEFFFPCARSRRVSSPTIRVASIECIRELLAVDISSSLSLCSDFVDFVFACLPSMMKRRNKNGDEIESLSRL